MVLGINGKQNMAGRQRTPKPWWRLVCRQRRRKLVCERWSVIHKRVATGKSALVAQESSPVDPAVAYCAGLTVYSWNCDTRHPRNDRGREATRAIAVDGW